MPMLEGGGVKEKDETPVSSEVSSDRVTIPGKDPRTRS